MSDRVLSFDSNVVAWRTGAELAFAMLREIEAVSLDETAYEASFRDGRPQYNVVAAYLAKVRATGDMRCETAFAAILTDHIASAMHAGNPDLDACQKAYARRPIATVPAAQGVP